jgi:octanoyl-[GcvH]:protein N-octanoyltransferase
VDRLRVLRDGPGPAAQAQVDSARQLLADVVAGAPETLRICRPTGPTVAFGRLDTLRPGYPQAVAATRTAGFEPAVRAVGGRAVAYDETCLVLDHVAREPERTLDTRGRFGGFGALHVDALRSLGVDARLGEVPDEYCPGPFSVNARGSVKLVGSAQRVTRGGWLFSAVVIVSGTQRLREVLAPVYAGIDMPFSPATVGSVADEVPGATADDVEDAVLEQYALRWRLVQA